MWVGDITYLPLVGVRRCYLATWRDAYSRRVMGWHLATQMPAELVLLALEQVLTLRQPAPGLMIHADREPVHQRRLPGPHRPSRGRAQLQPARHPL